MVQSAADTEHAAVLANLLALPASDRYPVQELSPQKLKEKTFAALLARLDALADRQPVYIIFEDVHWIDPTSLELLATIVERAPQLRVLLLITARPDFTEAASGERDAMGPGRSTLRAEAYSRGNAQHQRRRAAPSADAVVGQTAHSSGTRGGFGR